MINTVFNVQRFCVKDGPGIRTTVFFKGCMLNCEWCHNPESKSPKPVLVFHKNKCILCGDCARICANHKLTDKHLINRDNCVACGKCLEKCFGALEICGKEMTVDEILSEALLDLDFYKNSGGGITLSGGEPLYNSQFTKELLRQAKLKGLHTCIETCGYSKWEDLEKILPFVDIFLWDIKETDELLHKKYTGVSNRLILENLYKLNDKGAQIILRCPIIPTYNDREEHFAELAKIANKLDGVVQIEIMPYHPLGKSKSEDIGEEYPISELNFPTKHQVDEWVKTISDKTNKKVIKN